MMGKTWIDKKQLVIDIWARLRDGASPASLASDFEPSQRTIERLRQVAEAIENGQPVGEIADIGGWKTIRGANFKRFHKEFLDNYPSEQDGNQADNLPFLNLSTNQLWAIVSPIVESMWVPNPDEVPITLFERGSGFRTAVVRGRQFCWTQGMQERITSDTRGKGQIVKKFIGVEKVWYSNSEESVLLGVLQFLEQSQGKPIVHRYEELQESVIDYVRSSIRYQRGRVDSGWDSISKIWAAEQGGEKFDRENPYIAPGYTLMHEHPRLSGLVEEFKKDLRQIILSRPL